MLSLFCTQVYSICLSVLCVWVECIHSMYDVYIVSVGALVWYARGLGAVFLLHAGICHMYECFMCMNIVHTVHVWCIHSDGWGAMRNMHEGQVLSCCCTQVYVKCVSIYIVCIVQVWCIYIVSRGIRSMRIRSMRYILICVCDICIYIYAYIYIYVYIYDIHIYM